MSGNNGVQGNGVEREDGNDRSAHISAVAQNQSHCLTIDNGEDGPSESYGEETRETYSADKKDVTSIEMSRLGPRDKHEERGPAFAKRGGRSGNISGHHHVDRQNFSNLLPVLPFNRLLCRAYT